MSSELDSIIQLGRDITSTKYYSVATGTILMYDHLLTLADEIKYAWFGKKSWIFWVFILNRYLPITYQILRIIVGYNAHRSQLCDKTAWYSVFMFVVCTLLAQTVLTARIYAVTMRNTFISIGFAVITLSQLVLGIWMIVLAMKHGGESRLTYETNCPQSVRPSCTSAARPLPKIPFSAYNLCVFVQNRNLTVAYTCISLVYDTLAFLLIISLAVTLRMRGFGISTIIGTIAKDATLYFLVIFTSHFVLEMTLNLGREPIQLLPVLGNIAYLPVMVSRLMLSLRKAVDLDRTGWSLPDPPTSAIFASVNLFRPRSGTYWTQDEIPLDTYVESPTSVLQE